MFCIVPPGFSPGKELMLGAWLGTIPGVGVIPGVTFGFAGLRDGEMFGFGAGTCPG